MIETYLTIREVMALLKIGKSSVYRRIQDGTLPKPITLGHIQRFKMTEIDAAIDALSEQRP